MRKTSLFALATLAFISIEAQPLFTFGKKAVTKEEFLRQFGRNLNPNDDRAKAMKEYLPLFINYKLKVQDAYDKRMDTLPNQVSELVDFRRQIEENYFSEQANLNQLVLEAFDRSQKDLKLQDIYIEFDPKKEEHASEAAESAEKAMHKLEAGVDFDKVFDEFCTDKDFRATRGDLGWVSVFSLPYQMENEVYKLKVGGFTEPIKTKSAYHIIRKVAERKALGKVKVGQILLAFRPDATDADKAALRSLADSIHGLLQHGADFAEMARKYSNDKTSYQNGGALPEFGIGTYEKVFEDAAFGLQHKGDIAKPFATSYGVHILQLIDHMPVVSDKSNAEALSALKQRVIGDNRMEQAKVTLVKSLLTKIGHQPSKTLNKPALWKYTRAIIEGSKTAATPTMNDKTEIFRYTKQTIKAADWIMFIRATRSNVKEVDDRAFEDLFDQYVNVTAAEYYKQHLEEYEPDFKEQLQEFKDANLNFEITEKMVWNKAAEDSAGLARQYAANKNKYMWGPSVNAIIVTATDKATAETARKAMEANIKDWRAIAMKYENKLLADSNRFEKTQVPVAEGEVLRPGMFTGTLANPQDNSYTFCYILNIIDQPGQRSFEEARGFVINDHQQTLENRWIANLKARYPVKVNEAVWQSILKK